MTNQQMGDSDPDKKVASAPTWQSAARAKKDDALPPASSPESSGEQSQASTIEIAKKFLDEQKIKDASIEDKIKFLEEKGLDKEVIQKLLGAAQQVEASNMDPSTSPSNVSEEAERAVSQSTAPRAYTPMKRDTPPIVTYPEFLTTPPQPAPLVTTNRLLTTLYFFGGFSALLYGTSRYVVDPMAAALTEARHDLATTAQTKIDKLVTKLESAVSEIPAAPHSQLHPFADESDSDSDPTELFHRDIGIQTSLPNSPYTTRPQSPRPAENALTAQTGRLSAITIHVQSLNDAAKSEGEDAAEVKATMDVLKEYLTSLAYTTPNYTYGVYGTQQEKPAENDKIAELKATIRSVKGSLLSARTFPTTVGRAR